MSGKTGRRRISTVLGGFLTLLIVAGAGAQDQIQSTFDALIADPNATGEAWFELTQEARQAGELSIARKSIAHAAQSDLSPIRVAIEHARIETVSGNGDAAVSLLRSVFEQGFTAVGFLQNDAVFDALESRPDYQGLLDEMTSQAYPCANTEGFQDFDFWIGEWDVHVANGTFAGSNSIESRERGCVLVENWRSATGGTGLSINYLDRATGEWVQVWNAEGGSQINIRGGLTADGMSLKGTIHYVANGTTAPFRGLWTPLPDGRVRQYFEQSNDNGETWVPWFEGFYTRKEDADGH